MQQQDDTEGFDSSWQVTAAQPSSAARFVASLKLTTHAAHALCAAHAQGSGSQCDLPLVHYILITGVLESQAYIYLTQKTVSH